MVEAALAPLITEMSTISLVLLLPCYLSQASVIYGGQSITSMMDTVNTPEGFLEKKQTLPVSNVHLV